MGSKLHSSSKDERKVRGEYKPKKKATPVPIIIPELTEIGVYAQSVKPPDASWHVDGKMKDGPASHHLVNISESGLASHMTQHAVEIARDKPATSPASIPKTFGASMRLDDALFAGTAGYVLKPAALRVWW
ncbi:hypothetical protein VTI74DRAFT_2998 [Chaetomium olivicolor]